MNIPKKIAAPFVWGLLTQSVK